MQVKFLYKVEGVTNEDHIVKFLYKVKGVTNEDHKFKGLNFYGWFIRAKYSQISSFELW